MDDESLEALDDAAPATNPLDAVFDKAVKPFADSEALRAALPADAPVMRLKKANEEDTVTRELPGGGTLQIPVLEALRNSKVAE